MAGQRWSRRVGLSAGLLAVSAVGITSPPVSERASANLSPATTTVAGVPLSVLSAGTSRAPSVSGNGQFVVFEAAPATEDGRTSSVWLNDRRTGAITELTQPKQDVKLGNSVSPVISADGCAILVITEMAYDLFRDDDDGVRWDVYRSTNPSCGGQANDWSLVSTHTNADGFAEARGDVDPTNPPALSSGGTIVAYVRPFESLSGIEDKAYIPNAIDVVDLTIPIDAPGHTTPAPGLPQEMAGTPIKYAGQINPAVSADGSIVAYASDATSNQAVPEWVLPDDPAAPVIPTQIFAWNRNDIDPFTAVSLISQGPAGPADASAVQPVMSETGRVIAFSSAATNLFPNEDLAACGRSCAAQVYVVDRDANSNAVFDEAGATSLDIVSAVPEVEGEARVVGNGSSFSPTISADGTTVVFVSQARNLMPVQTPGGGETGDGDVLIADLHQHDLRRAFDSPEPVPGAHSHPRLSANGRLLVADSLVADQLLGDPALTGRRVVAAAFAPVLSIADIDLGTISVGVPGPGIYVNIVNEGPGSFLPTIIASDRPEVFSVNGGSTVSDGSTRRSCLDRAPVHAGSSCSIELQLIPDRAGPLKATLTIAEVGFGAITLSVPLKGAGGEPALDAYPVGADFTPTVVGQRNATHIDVHGQVAQGSIPFTITNIGLVPTRVTSIKVTGAHPNDFVVSSNGCLAEVQFYSTCIVEVAFVPTAAGRRTASINFATSQHQYTSVFVAGEAYYSASIVTAPSVKPGDNLPLGLLGFPANSAVVIGWSDGSGTPMIGLTDANGGLLANLRVRQSERPGTKTLVVQVPGGISASALVEIERVRSRRG